jgi:DNA-binding MarR family transcriptional regulator/sRNA-binding regulator protein Hfq
MLNLLTQLGFTSTQSEIFLYLYQYGPKPASSVAKKIGSERTNTYKIIETMMRHGLVAETNIQNTKQFYIPDKQVLRHQLEHQKQLIQTQETVLLDIEQWLAQLDQERISPLPAMRFFQWSSDMSNLVDDMIHTIQSHNYKMIRCFATNTLESQTGSHSFDHYASQFLSYLHQYQISVELYLGNGILLLEHMVKSYDKNLLADLPAGQASLMVYIIGSVVYIILFKAQPAAIKIESQELADVIGFLLKQV